MKPFTYVLAGAIAASLVTDAYAQRGGRGLAGGCLGATAGASVTRTVPTTTTTASNASVPLLTTSGSMMMSPWMQQQIYLQQMQLAYQQQLQQAYLQQQLQQMLQQQAALAQQR